MSIKIDDISDSIAEKLGVNKYKLREINRAQWKLLLDTIQSNNLKTVKIMYLGKFLKKKNVRHKGNLPGIQKPDI